MQRIKKIVKKKILKTNELELRTGNKVKQNLDENNKSELKRMGTHKISNYQNSVIRKHTNRINQTKHNSSTNQTNLFKPEALLVINQVNHKLGKKVISLGCNKLQKEKTNDFSLDNNFLDLKSVNDVNLIKEKSTALIDKYKQIEKLLDLYAKANNTNANIYKRKKLEREKQQIKQVYLILKDRINSLS